MGKAKKTRKIGVNKRRINPKKATDTSKQVKKDGNKKKVAEDAIREAPKAGSAGMFFQYNTNLLPPYYILIDTNFINFSIQHKMDILQKMMDCLLGKCIPCISDCVVGELEKMGHRFRLALKLARDARFKRLTCVHKGTYADDCIVQRVIEHKCYIVATNDKDLKRRLRKIPANTVAALAKVLPEIPAVVTEVVSEDIKCKAHKQDPSAQLPIGVANQSDKQQSIKEVGAGHNDTVALLTALARQAGTFRAANKLKLDGLGSNAKLLAAVKSRFGTAQAQFPATEDPKKTKNVARILPPQPVEVLPKVQGVSRPIIAASRGFASLAGKKHKFDDQLNEDSGKLDTFLIYDKKASPGGPREPKWVVDSALIFDGHGRMGRHMSRTAVDAMRNTLIKQLGEVVLAPTLKQNDPKFTTESKQAAMCNVMNSTAQQLITGPDRLVSRTSGTTATTVLAISPAGEEEKPVEILASNLGDSRVLLIEMNTIGRYDPNMICTMSQEHNIRMPDERQTVIAKMTKQGYYKAAVDPNRKRSLDVFLPSWFSQPRLIMNTSDVKKLAIEVAAQNFNAPIYCISGGKLRKYKVNSNRGWRSDVSRSGLQLTGSMGDCDFEPFKRHLCEPREVQIVRLQKKQNNACILIAASDGLWDYVQTMHSQNGSFARLVGKWWSDYGNIVNNPSQSFAQYLVDIASGSVSDDVTVAVMHYPGLAIFPEDLKEFRRSMQ